FQAEDGVRDGHVTGVQTCALPICSEGSAESPWYRVKLDGRNAQVGARKGLWVVSICLGGLKSDPTLLPKINAAIDKANAKVPKRSEERREVKRLGLGGGSRVKRER